jgi:TATA-box binding protein (TBP) (component of TFIID and TFIIIB)
MDNKNIKSGFGSKTSKPIKNTLSSKLKKKTMKKTFSGSKTTNPKKKLQDTKDTNETIDVNKIFDIIDSETSSGAIQQNDIKRKEITDKKEMVKIIDPILNNLDKNINNVNNVNNPNKNVINSYFEAKQFLQDHGITISTITLDCKLHTLIDVDKFAKNVILKEDGIVSIKFGNRKDPATNRTIVVLKTKKKPSVKNFYNQVTILMKPMNNPSRNYINIKVFKNGSLQMTGCKDMNDFNNVTLTLIKILKKGRDIKNKKGEIVHIDFIDKPKEIGIYDIKIRMINSNFKLDYKVDRKKLAKLLEKNHSQGTKDKDLGYIECKYEPTSGHSCVNIKYRYDDKNKPSIFVFQTGAIIITGAKTLPQIIMAYHFIHKVLNKYYNEIRIIDLDHNAVQAEIAKFFRNNKKNSNIQLIDC